MLEDAMKEESMPRTTLEKFERAKILEVYFARLDGRTAQNIPSEFAALYELDLQEIKTFLLGQHPRDNLLHSLFRVMN
jgi:hypothetical protein